LGVVVGTLPAGSFASCNRQSSESYVVHDHVRLCHDQVVAVARTCVRVGTRHMKHAGTTGGGETVRSSSGSGELGSVRGTSEMIGDGCSDAILRRPERRSWAGEEKSDEDPTPDLDLVSRMARSSAKKRTTAASSGRMSVHMVALAAAKLVTIQPTPPGRPNP
jgi:hypothetical protein